MKIFTIITLKIIFFYSTFVSAEVKIAALYAESGPVSEIAEAIAEATPSPAVPYANKQIGTPIFPVFGKNMGGNSAIGSFLRSIKKIKSINAKADKIITA